MTAGLVGQWLDSGALDLPLPGSGDTARAVAAAGRADRDRRRGRPTGRGAHRRRRDPGRTGRTRSATRISCGGCGRRSRRDAVLCAPRRRRRGHARRHQGVVLGRGAVHARAGDGAAGLRRSWPVRGRPARSRPCGRCPAPGAIPGWPNQTPAQCNSAAPRPFAVGRPGEYLARPGFWHGAIGVSACWLGGARAVAAPLYERAADDSVDPHTLAHLGAVDAALAAAEAMLMAAAAEVDADPLNRKGIGRTDRAADPRRGGDRRRRDDHPHGARARARRRCARTPSTRKRVADLTIYVRQSHAERDLERLGRLAGADDERIRSRPAAGNGARFAARPLTGGGTPDPGLARRVGARCRSST